MERLLDGVARVFSTLFHPLILPTIGLFILFRLNTYISLTLPLEVRRYVLLMVFVNTAILPVLSVLVLKRTGHIRDYLLRERAERLLPLMVAAVTFFMTYYLLRQLQLPSLIDFFMMGATLLVLLSLLISIRWKISIHMVSLGGLTGFMIVTALLLQPDMHLLIMAAFLVSGLTAASRLHVKAHKPAEVYAGYLLGVLVMILLYLFLRV